MLLFCSRREHIFRLVSEGRVFLGSAVQCACLPVCPSSLIRWGHFSQSFWQARSLHTLCCCRLISQGDVESPQTQLVVWVQVEQAPDGCKRSSRQGGSGASTGSSAMGHNTMGDFSFCCPMNNLHKYLPAVNWLLIPHLFTAAFPHLCFYGITKLEQALV